MTNKKNAAGLVQLSLFDIELPTQNMTKEEEPKHIKTVSPARVPDEEYSRKHGKVPTVKEILKLMERGTYRAGAHEFLSDVFECGAIAISNQFDYQQSEKREQRYLQIIKKYDRDMQELITEVFAKIYLMLTQQIDVGFSDYLGELFMQSETMNKYTGQFFTPYQVSKLCAKMSIHPEVVAEHMEADSIITLNEPACGAGGMVIAAADVLYNDYHFNIASNLLVECSDIDSRCVHMSYLQLGLAGIPAVIYRRNTLTMETWERWETPAYIMQWNRFRNIL